MAPIIVEIEFLAPARVLQREALRAEVQAEKKPPASEKAPMKVRRKVR